MAIPKNMSPMDYKTFDRLAVQMNYYHNSLRSQWNEIYTGTAPGAKQPSTASLLARGIYFCDHLKGHHDIEEAIWFPVLGRKMDGFRPGHFAQEQHKDIHKGLDVFPDYLRSCKRGEADLERPRVRAIMDSFGGILWQHLDEEVEQLGAENMVKYWTKEEMGSFPF